MARAGAGRYAQSRAELVDCARHGPGSGAELILVEGESAQKAVVAVRSARTQAVLPLQGKPLNAWVASREKVHEQTLFRQLATALGLDSPIDLPTAGLDALRHERLVLLFDPDADGIHIGALMQLYVARWLAPLVDAGRLWLVRAPMFEILDADGVVHHALSPSHRDRLLANLARPRPASAVEPSVEPASALAPPGGPSRLPSHLPTQAPQVRALRGLASFAPTVLSRLCVDPATRLARAVTAEDLRDVVALFGHGR
jgi:DNA gyrase subunit B